MLLQSRWSQRTRVPLTVCHKPTCCVWTEVEINELCTAVDDHRTQIMHSKQEYVTRYVHVLQRPKRDRRQVLMILYAEEVFFMNFRENGSFSLASLVSPKAVGDIMSWYHVVFVRRSPETFNTVRSKLLADHYDILIIQYTLSNRLEFYNLRRNRAQGFKLCDSALEKKGNKVASAGRYK
jgi:hypothetical protein